MPRSTFYHLSEEKQQKIIASAKQEFSKRLYQDASINQIIKDCGISHGSFYMYFYHKEDLYFYLLEEYRKKVIQLILSTIKKYEGKIFVSFREIFLLLYSKIQKENTPFMENIFKNMNYLIENQLLRKKPEKVLEDHIYEQLDTTGLTITKKTDIYHLLHIIIMLMINNLNHVIHQEKEWEKIKDVYDDQLRLLEKAFVKGGKE